MLVTTLWRYPVKSMLGEELTAARASSAGFRHDRGLAVIDLRSGVVATAKHPRLWRDLLKYSARVDDDRVVITSPSGWVLDAAAPEIDGRLSEGLSRPVHLAAERPNEASVERPAPEDVLDHGVEATVAAPTLLIGQGSPGSTFVDYAPLHLITSATLSEIGAEPVRYRPNLVLDTPPRRTLMSRTTGSVVSSVSAIPMIPPSCSGSPSRPHAARFPLSSTVTFLGHRTLSEH